MKQQEILDGYLKRYITRLEVAFRWCGELAVKCEDMSLGRLFL